MIYLDTSAAVKLLRAETESHALTDWINSQQFGLVSSTLLEIELTRAVRRIDVALLPLVPGLLARVSRHEMDATVRQAAATYTDPRLRSLDAIHLATAHVALAGRVHWFCCYDIRLTEAAAGVGLATVAPGLTA